MKNRLHESNSPYLHQHADNPVAWQPWDDTALQLAQEQDKPIFLSVGYSTCHWCHVMAHESFEHQAVADLLNEHFIPIKVDREERPDIDEQYMLATQIFTRRGGWPNSVWLTPDGRPWMAGTYFPREDRHGQHGFITILKFLHEAWLGKRDEIEEQANQITQAIRELSAQAFGQEAVDLNRQLLDIAMRHSEHQFDSQHGGFASAPKFPPHGTLRWMIYEYQQSPSEKLLNMITTTMDAMALGGVYDQVGGGFHRYSTDAIWLIPHFEKMLYDNGQLVRSYAQLAAMTELPNHKEYERVIAETFAWLQREMTSPEGAFYAALDADSEGEEGKCYVWDTDEVTEILGKQEAQFFNNTYQMLPTGNWTDEATGEPMHTNIPHLNQFPSEHWEVLNIAKTKLLEVRDQRIQPHLDQKVITGWNGLMIAGLADAGRLLNEPKYIEAAIKSATYLQKQHYVDQQLYRIRNEGQAAILAYLDDYAYLIDALLALTDATEDNQWQGWAIELANQMMDLFEDDVDGGFFSSSIHHEALLMRSKDPGSGGNTPTANGVAASILLELSRRTGELKYAESAQRTLIHYGPVIASQPYLNEAVLLGLSQYLAQPPKALEDHDPGQGADAWHQEGPVSFHLYLSHESINPKLNTTVMVLIKGKLQSGWTMYAEVEPDQGYFPFNVFLEDSPQLELGNIQYGDTHQKLDEISGLNVSIYQDNFEILVPVHLAPDIEDTTVTLPVLLQAQICGEGQCLPPMTLKFPLNIELGEQSLMQHENIFETLYNKSLK